MNKFKKKIKNKIKWWIIRLIGMDTEISRVEGRLKAFEDMVEIGVDVGHPIHYRANTTFIITSRLGTPNADGTVRIFDKEFKNYHDLLGFIREIKRKYNVSPDRIRMDLPRHFDDNWRERV